MLDAGTVMLGRELEVPRIGLGTMKLTGSGTWGMPRDPAAARALLRRARDLGVRLFDTADSYGPDASETLIREALYPYADVVVATKGGHTRQGPSLWRRDGRPEHLRNACHGSLHRLGVECIDLYQLHAVDPNVPIEESLGALAELQSEGTIRHIGVSNVSASELERGLAVVDIVSVRNRFNLSDRSSQPVLEMCEQLGIPFIAWAPLATGRLADARGVTNDIARRLGATRPQVALAWLLQRSPCIVPIPGTRSASHLEQNLSAGRLQLEAEDLTALGRPVQLGSSPRELARSVRSRVRRIGRWSGRR